MQEKISVSYLSADKFRAGFCKGVLTDGLLKAKTCTFSCEISPNSKGQ